MSKGTESGETSTEITKLHNRVFRREKISRPFKRTIAAIIDDIGKGNRVLSPFFLSLTYRRGVGNTLTV